MVPEYSNPEVPEPLRVGVIGASGWASMAHLPAIAATPGIQLTAVATSRSESARRIAEETGAGQWFTSATELAACDDVDLVTISVKAPLHRQLVEEVVVAGKPVLCEWPLGVSTQESELIADTASQAGITGFIDLQAMANPTLSRLGQIVGRGTLGTLVSVTVRASRGSKEPIQPAAEYTLDARNGAGTLDILGGHTLAALATALGRPAVELLPGGGTSDLVRSRLQTADGGTIDITTPDVAASLIRLRPGLATVLIQDADPRPGTEITITGTRGKARATTVDFGQPRLQQPQIAGWQAEITTGEGRTAFADPQTALPVPARNISALYQLIRSDLTGGSSLAPTFDSALAIHRALDTMRDAQ